MNARAIIEAEPFHPPPVVSPFKVSPPKPRDPAQGVMNRAYQRWRTGDLKGLNQPDFYQALGEPDKMVTMFGNANYQICNGGFSQWISNGYADAAFNDLKEYCKKWGKSYPAIAKFGTLLDRLESDFEDNNPHGRIDTFAEMVDYDPSEKVKDAIMQKDWPEVDELLGGTECNERAFDRGVEDFIRHNVEVDTYSTKDVAGKKISVSYDGSETETMRRELKAKMDGEQLAPPSPPTELTELWAFKLTLEHNDETVDLIDTGDESHDANDGECTWFASEEDAEEAAQEFINKESGRGGGGRGRGALSYNNLCDEATEIVDNAVLDELCNEYGHLGGGQLSFDRLDNQFYEFNEGLMAELNQLLDDNYPDDVATKAKATLKKFWTSVKQGATRVVSGVTGIKKHVKSLPGRLARAGAAAAQAFSAKESLEPRQIVAQLLGEE